MIDIPNLNEPSWRINDDDNTVEQKQDIDYLISIDVLIPDTRLQAIADAWNSIQSDGHRVAFKSVVDWWPELAVLLDALTESEPIDIVSRQLLANSIDEMRWEDMPDIGEYDWLRIVERCKELAPEPGGFNDAILILEDSAQDRSVETDVGSLFVQLLDGPKLDGSPPVEFQRMYEVAKAAFRKGSGYPKDV